MSENEDRDLTLIEAKEILNVSTVTIVRWIRKGHFPGAYKLDPDGQTSPWRIPKSAVLAFLERRRRSAY